MPIITLQEAQANLADLVHRLEPGEVVTIVENERPVARLMVPLAAPSRPARLRPPVTGVPRAGQYEGRLVVPDDLKNRWRSCEGMWNEPAARYPCHTLVSCKRPQVVECGTRGDS